MKVSERDVSHVMPLLPSQQPSDGRSMISLLKMLHSRVRREKRSSFQQILPAYEQLLTHVRTSALSRRSRLSPKRMLNSHLSAYVWSHAVVYRGSALQIRQVTFSMNLVAFD